MKSGGVIAFLWLACSLIAEEERLYANPQEEEAALFQHAEKTWNEINAELEIYLAYYHGILLENESDLRASGEWEAEQAREASLRPLIKKLQDDFVAFRDSFDQAIQANYGRGSYTRMLSVKNRSDLTEAYANQIKEMIFPSHWEEISKKQTAP